MSLTEFTLDEQKALEEKWTIVRFVYFPIGLVSSWGLAASWPSDFWVWQAFWTVVTAYVFFCYTSLFHETAHQTLCGSKAVSIWLGRSLGTLIGVPYTAYRETHIRHHAYLNKPNDWELWPYSDPNTSVGFRRAFVWADLILGTLTGPYIYGRICFHKDSPIKSPKIRAAVRYEYLAVVILWTAILSTVAYFGDWRQFAKVWLIPFLLAGVFQSVRKFTEHLGMSSYDPILGTRTVVGRTLWTRICTFLNFDIFIHGAHHRHPRVAHHQLKQKMEDFVDQNPDHQLPIYPSYWRATLAFVPSLIRNPGVGMNAGAPPPGREKSVDVDNFVQDVTLDILAESDAAPIMAVHSER